VTWPQTMVRCSLFVFISFACLGLALAADDPLQAVQGTWIRQQRTPEGLVKVVKVHEGTTTTLTGYDPHGKAFYQHVSEFSVDTTGKVNTLTFFNRKIVKGQGAGSLNKEPSSYIYRIENDRFYEAQGLLAGDEQSVRVIVWQRQQPAQNPPADDP
jgi:hypothetical protein